MKIKPPSNGLMVAALVLSLAGCGEVSEEQAIKSAQRNLEEKNASAAVVQLKAALQNAPESHRLRFMLGKSLLVVGDGSSAALELTKALDLKHPLEETLPELGRALLRAGDAKKLIDKYGRLVLADKAGMADFKATLAYAHLQLGDANTASSVLQESLAIEPMQIRALLLKAMLLRSRDDIDGAQAILKQALSIDPRNIQALSDRANLSLQGKSDVPAAIAQYREVLAVDATVATAQAALITLLMQQQDLVGARAQMESMRKLLPKNFLTGYLDAQFALLDGDLRKARNLIQVLLQLAPQNARANVLAGAIESQAGALRLAEDYFSKALQYDPDFALARRMLGKTYLRSGATDKALAIVEPLNAQGRDAEAIAITGEAYLQRGDLQRAEASFAKAALLDPHDSRSRISSALIRVGKGDTEAGFAELHEVARVSPSAHSAMALVSALLRSNDSKRALAAIDSIEKQLPDKAFVPYLRGRVLLTTQDGAGARAAFERSAELDSAYFPAASSLAEIELAQGAPEKAETRFDAVLKADPKNSRALLAKAEIKSRRGGVSAEAIALISAAVKANPADVQARVRLARELIKSGQSPAALVAAQDAATAIPNDPAILTSLGDAQLAVGNPQQAVNTFGRLVVLRPQSAVPLLKMAEARGVMGEKPAMLKLLARALEVEPGNVTAQRMFIVQTIAAGQADQALRLARQVQKQSPSSDLGYLFEGDIEAARKRWDAAGAAYKLALQRQPGSEAALKRHLVLVQGGKVDEAARFAKAWLNRWPGDVRFTINLAEIAVRNGALAEAEDLYRQSIKAKSEQPTALSGLARVLLLQRKTGAAVYAEQAAKLLPNNPGALEAFATALAAENQPARALDVQKSALALRPGDPQMRVNLAKMLIQNDKKAEAKSELSKLLEDKSASAAGVLVEARKLFAQVE